MSLILRHWEPNGFSLMALMALYEKQLDFEARYEDWIALDAAADAPMEEAYNLERAGPVLVHEGRIITDSFFMALYLDEAFAGPALTPPGPDGLWDALVWGRLAGEMLAPSIATLGCKAHLAPLLASRDRDQLRRAIARLPTPERRDAWTAALDNAYCDADVAEAKRKIRVVAEKIESRLAQHAWLTGGAFSVSDLEMFALAVSAPALGAVSETDAPRLLEWLARIRDRPSYKKALSHSRTGAPAIAFAPGPEHSRWG